MEENRELSEREERVLSSLVKGAYPHPSDDIRNNVMRRIRMEKALKRKKQADFLRWGSLAAALVFVVIAGVTMMPKLGVKISVDMEKSMERAMMAEDVLELCEAADNGSAENDIDYMDAFDELKNDEAEEDNGTRHLLGSTASPTTSNAASDDVSEMMIYKGESTSIATAYFDVDGDGENELVKLTRDDDSDAVVVNVTVGEATYASSPLDRSAEYSFEHVNNVMVLREYFKENGKIYYYKITCDGEVALTEAGK